MNLMKVQERNVIISLFSQDIKHVQIVFSHCEESGGEWSRAVVERVQVIVCQ